MRTKLLFVIDGLEFGGGFNQPAGFANSELDSLARDLGFHGTVSLKPATFPYAADDPFVGRFTLTAKSTLDRITAVFPVDTP